MLKNTQPAFKFNGGAEALKKLENGEIPEKELWKYSSFWFKDFDGMAFKTMLRQLISKWGIMSIEMQSAYVNDMAFKDESGQGLITSKMKQILIRLLRLLWRMKKNQKRHRK